MTAVQPRHWSSAPAVPNQMAAIAPPGDTTYSSLPASPLRSSSSQTVRHVPHSPSFRQVPVTVPSYAFMQTPRAGSPGPAPSPPNQQPPTVASRPVLPPPAPSPTASSPDLSHRYRRGHRRSEVSISAAPRSVSAPTAIPSLTRSWSSQSLPATPTEPSHKVNPPLVKPLSYHQSFPQQPALQHQQHQSHPQHGIMYSPEQYYHMQRQSPAAVYGRTQSPVRQSQPRLEIHHSSRSSSSSSVSSISVEPPSRYNAPMHSRKASVASVASGDSRHARHPSVDSVVSTSSSGSRATSQLEQFELRSRLRPGSVVPMDRSGAEALLVSSASKPVSAPTALEPMRVVGKHEKKVSRFQKALSFIAPGSTHSGPTATPKEIEDEVIEYNFGNNSIYENRQRKADDNLSIRSTASSVSKALKRISRFGGSKGASVKSDTSSIVIDDGESVRLSNDEDQCNESVRKVALLKKVDFVPKSILKNAGGCQIEITTEEILPGLTRESSLISYSSSSSSSLKGAAQQQGASHRSMLSHHSSVSFSPEIKIYTTWNSGEYDRKIPDAVPFSTYPLWMIAQIKEEINTYKKMEMEIHELSRGNTCFY
ncbi:hypothetical protein V1517DRAFT_126027 [Lipomyces orientalis]|uniref:Uncharacterized protein n=1 Tax=Lipomyces orientalis TaxID=1233043 RepID=A0ACC3TY13_9ASCO